MRSYYALLREDGVIVLGGRGATRPEVLSNQQFLERTEAMGVNWTPSGHSNVLVFKVGDPYTETIMQTRFQLR